MKRKLLILLCALLLLIGAGSVWGAGTTRTLTDGLSVSGFKAKAFYNFQNNTPAVLPTSGDLRYRDGNVWGLHNFASGSRSAVVSIPVSNGEILVIQEYDGQAGCTTINKGSKNSSLSASTGYAVFDISTSGDDITFTVARYGGVVAALVMEEAPVGTFYMKNKETGAYFAAGSNWGTKAITNTIGHTVTISEQSGGYQIDTQISNGGASHYLNGVYTDGAATDWTIESDGAGYYTISNNSGKLTAGAVGADLSITDGTGDNTKWKMLTVDKWKEENVARLDDATASNSKDATFYIPAANFNRNDNTENAKWQGGPDIGGYSGDDPKTNFVAEKYGGDASAAYTNFDVYQELTGLKPGYYKLQVQGFYRNGTTDDRNAILYANSSEVALKNIHADAPTSVDSDNGFVEVNDGKYVPNDQSTAAKAFNHGSYENELFVVVNEDGALKVGVKKTGNTLTEWTCFDNFRLTYYGYDFTGFIQNPSFESATAARETNITGWTNTTETLKFQTQNSANEVKVGTYYVERWQASGSGPLNDATFTQTISNMPAGNYKLTANARNIEQYYGDMNGAGMYLKLGANRVEVNSTVLTETYTTLTSAGNLEMGVVLDGCTGNWVQFDNFQLTYNPTMPNLVAVEGEMDSDIASAQASALAAYNSSKTANNYYTAKAAIAAAQASADAYARGAAINALIDGEGSVVVDEEAVADNWTPVPELNTWSVEGETDGSNMKTPFLQNWRGSGIALRDNTNTYLAKGIKNGYYEVTALVRVLKENGGGVSATSAAFGVNGVTDDLITGASTCTNGIYKTVNVKTVVTDNTLNISLAYSGANFNWISWKNLKVTYLGNDFTSLIKNPGFEGSYSSQTEPREGRDIYKPEGWTVTYGSTDEWNMTSLNSSCTQWNQFKDLPQPADGGDNVYWIRYRYDNSGSLKLSQTVSLPAGTYVLAAEAYNEKSAQVTATLAVKVDETTYSNVFEDNQWYHSQVNFNLSAAKDVEISFTYKKTNNTEECRVGIDNFTLKLLDDISAGDDVTALILNPDCNTNDGWLGSGRSFGKNNDYSNPDVTDWTETTRNVFSNNIYPDGGYNRSQTVTFPLAGWYRLDVLGLVEATTGIYGAKVVNSSSETLVEKKQNYDQSLNYYTLNTDGIESSTVKTGGTGWTKQELYFNVPNTNDAETIHLYLSRGGNGGNQYAFIGGLKLTYLGSSGSTANMQVSATAKVGTFCAPYDVTVPARVTAHTVSQGSGDWITLSDPLEGGVIPAGTPVILQAEDGISTAIQKTYFGTGNTAASDSYVLKGLYEAEEKESGANPYYILQYYDGAAAFYLVPTGQSRNLAANRCYLQPESDSTPARIAIGGDDDPTAINEVEAIEAEARTMKDGKYLVKGRIVLVKNGKAYSANGQKLN